MRDAEGAAVHRITLQRDGSGGRWWRWCSSTPKTEQICEGTGSNLILPKHELRNHLDSRSSPPASSARGRRPLRAQCAGTRGQLQAAADQPGATAQTRDGSGGPDALRRLRQDHLLHRLGGRLGPRLRKTSSAKNSRSCKRINNRALAVEAVNTATAPWWSLHDRPDRLPELTPYRAAGAATTFPEALSEAHRTIAIGHVRRLGRPAAPGGYRGCFEVDVLVDLDSDEVYLGELNPRISGASSMTNVTAGAYPTSAVPVPPAGVHGVDYSLDVDEINDRWRELAAVDVWAQLIAKARRGRRTDSGRPADRSLPARRGRRAEFRRCHQRLARRHP